MNTLPWQKLPRFELGHWPTPLEPLKRLSYELGGPTIWVKRDDCTGLAIGGNKTRKLEFLLGAAIEAGADTILTFGAVQSNHTRQTAAACAKAGIACHMILSRRVASNDRNYETGGNVMLGRILQAQQHFVEPDEAADYAETLLAKLKLAGHNVYVIPAGGSNATGALGYAVCAEELVHQTQQLGIDLNHVVHASASSGTQAGLVYGLQHLYGLQARDVQCDVLGINVFHPDPATLEHRVRKVIADMHAKFPSNLIDETAEAQVKVNHAYLGEGYGQATAEGIAAIKMVAGLEGLLFDPVYSGKALAAVIDQITVGNFHDADNVILIHTGGTPALNVYSAEFA